MQRFFLTNSLSRAFKSEVGLKAKTGRPNEAGATIVEFSIISIMFFVLMVGTLDFSMAMFDMNGANFGTRSQARLASNGEWGTDLTCDLQLEPGPSLDQDLHDLLCSTKAKMKVAPERVRVRVRFEDPDYPTNDVLTIKPQLGKSLVLCTMTSMRSLSGVFGPLVRNKVLTSVARSRIERDLSVPWKITGSPVEKGPLFPGVVTELAFVGANWDFCQPKPIGDDGGDWTTVPPSTEYCKLAWSTNGEVPVDPVAAYAPGTDVTFYNLEADVANLSRDPWNSYSVIFDLPLGHIPFQNRSQFGNLEPGNSPTNWKFTKSSTANPPDYGVPLADGDRQPGNGVAIGVNVEATAPSRSVPTAFNATIDGKPCT